MKLIRPTKEKTILPCLAFSMKIKLTNMKICTACARSHFADSHVCFGENLFDTLGLRRKEQLFISNEWIKFRTYMWEARNKFKESLIIYSSTIATYYFQDICFRHFQLTLLQPIHALDQGYVYCRQLSMVVTEGKRNLSKPRLTPVAKSRINSSNSKEITAKKYLGSRRYMLAYVLLNNLCVCVIIRT